MLSADDALAGRLQALVDRLASRKRIPHAILGLASGDGPLRWIGASGPARPDGTPMRPDTPYMLASVTKLYIGTTILQLYERGEVDLDAPITAYLAVDRVAGLHRLGGVDHTSRITVRHLLGHTSGLPDYLEDRPSDGRRIYEEIEDGVDRSWTFDDVIEIARGMRPRFEPQDLSAGRQKARYSDTGFQLLLMIIESVAGRPFYEVFEEGLFRPFGLRHTWVPGRSEPLDPPPDDPAAVWAKGRPIHIPKAMASTNDLMGTADDTLRFMGALTRGEVFQDPATYRLMHERWNRIFYPMRYGLATMRYRVPKLFGPGRRAVTLVGHSGTTGSWLLHCPELDLVLTGTVDEASARAVPFRFLPRVLKALQG
ncbi:MAG TPA: serine hydrolase domain-containing protein [Actinomycetota bacterium]